MKLVINMSPLNIPLNIPQSIKGIFTALLGAALFNTSAIGQINIDQLDAASAYDAGVLRVGSGSLESTLWRGTSALRATALLKDINAEASGRARALIKAAVLSGGVPPTPIDKIDRDAYVVARLGAVLRLGNLTDFDELANQSGIHPNNPTFARVLTNSALLGNDNAAACSISDVITTGRKQPYWAKMRAFCHVLRGEIPAGELTSDILSRSGYKDDQFFDLFGKITGSRPEIKVSNIHNALGLAMVRTIRQREPIEVKTLPLIYYKTRALDTSQKPDDRLSALLLGAPLMSPDQIRSVVAELAPGLADAPLEDIDQLHTEETWDAKMWGGVYAALTTSANMDTIAALTAAILVRADEHKVLAAFTGALAPEIQVIPPDYKEKYGAGVFARAAVLARDSNSLVSMFQAVDADDPLRSRIALASDALGGGFRVGTLGQDIEARLAGTGSAKTQAVRDSYIAVALGAKLPFDAEQILSASNLQGRQLNPSDLLAARSAARRGAQAEVALRAAKMIDGTSLRDDAFADVLSILMSAGMSEQAGQLAALDFLEGNFLERDKLAND